MRYILIVAAMALVFSASAQVDMQRTSGNAQYRIFTQNSGDKIKISDVLTFDVIQKTDKDSVLASSYAAGQVGKTQCVDPKTINDYLGSNLMEILPKLALNDSVLMKFPTDSMFKGHDDQRPLFFPKGSNLVIVMKIRKIQSLAEAKAEHDAEVAAQKAGMGKMRAADSLGAIKYIADHKLVLKTAPSGLKYAIRQSTLKPKPLPGDTVFVNYTGRTLDGVVFDSSIEADAKAAGLNQPGRTYEPISFTIGAGGIIPGWDEGLRYVPEGGKALLFIPPMLGYGESGSGAIKPYSTLIFDIELVKIKPGKHPALAKPKTAPAGAKKPVHKTPVKHS